MSWRLDRHARRWFRVGFAEGRGFRLWDIALVNRENGESLDFDDRKQAFRMPSRSKGLSPCSNYRIDEDLPGNASHETLGCQFTNAPLGFSLHAQTCRV